jgi:hypothetical protein
MHDSIWEGGWMIVHVYNLRPNGQHFTLWRGGGGENQIAILAKDEHRIGGVDESLNLHCSTFFNII